MAKKIWFSQPLATQWDTYLQNYKYNKENEDDFFKRMIQGNGKLFIENNWKKDQLNSFIWSLWYSDVKKELLHLYFMDKNLKDFLENTPLADLEGIIKYINDNGIIENQGCLQLKYFSFGIHIPYENKYKAFAFGLMNNQFDDMILTWAVEKGGAWCSVKNYKELIKTNSEEAKKITKIFRFAINTIAYMEAFPECVKEGVPSLISENNKEKSYILEIAEKVLEPVKNAQTGKIVSPHFRKGYYKRLSSDFFKNKKGQIIFVSETMVKGKAKTIYTSDQIKN